MSTLLDTMTALADRVAWNNTWRQRECINLIPSETTPSLLVKACEVADAAGRYAEHRRLKGEEVYFYQGTDFIQEIEEEVHVQAQRFFGCDRVEARPVSGQLANIVVFEALLRLKNRGNDGPMRRLSSVVNNGLIQGGHLSAQAMGALFNAVDRDSGGAERAYPIPVRADNPYLADTEALLKLVGEQRPDLIVFGKSMFLHPEPVREVAELTAGLEEPPLLMFDMAHVLGSTAPSRIRSPRARRSSPAAPTRPSSARSAAWCWARGRLARCGRTCAIAPVPAPPATTTWAR